MDAFSYLSVLLSIIIGLAITQVLQGYRALLLARRHVALYAPTLAWSVYILLMATQSWWASFGLSDRRDWSFLAFAIPECSWGLCGTPVRATVACVEAGRAGNRDAPSIRKPKSCPPTSVARCPTVPSER